MSLHEIILLSIPYQGLLPLLFRNEMIKNDNPHSNRSLFIMISLITITLRGFAKKEKFKKSDITMEVGGWVQVSLRIVFFLENHLKISLNQY